MVTTQAYTLTVHLAFTPQTSKGQKLPSHSPPSEPYLSLQGQHLVPKEVRLLLCLPQILPQPLHLPLRLRTPFRVWRRPPVPAALGALRREGQPAGFGRHRRRRPRALLVGRPLCAARRCCKRGLRHPQRLGGWEWGWTIALRPPKEHETWPWLCGLKLFGEAVYSKSFRCSSLCCSCVFVCKLNFASYSISSGCLGRTGSELPLLMSNEFHLVMFHSPMLFVHLWCRTRAAVQGWYSPHEQPCEPPKKTATYFDLGSDT